MIETKLGQVLLFPASPYLLFGYGIMTVELTWPTLQWNQGQEGQTFYFKLRLYRKLSIQLTRLIRKIRSKYRDEYTTNRICRKTSI